MMFRIILLLIFSCAYVPAQAKNTVQNLFNKVNDGVVELHVRALISPEPGEVSYQATTSDSLGSGALISAAGRILTAAHVIDRALDIEVVFNNGDKTSGHVVWIDPLLDLALIQAAKVPEMASVLTLAKSADYQIGDQVIVIGAPYGVSHSLSVGYLSGIRDQEQIPGMSFLPRFLQTDAAINQGNSGGPMFNSEGEIIGIVSHILSNSGGSNGLGFSVSVDTIHHVMNSNPGTFSGLIPHLLTEKQAKALNNPFGHGLLVQHVIPGSLADKMGFRGGHLNVLIGQTPILLGGDIILSIGGYPIKDLTSALILKKRFSEYQKDDKVSFRFLREGIEQEVFWVVD